MYRNQIEEARALATQIGHSFSADNTFPVIVIQYVPDLGTGAAAASITYRSTTPDSTGGFLALVDAAAPAGKDLFRNAAGTLDIKAARTLGRVLDAFNANSAWRAYLVGGLRTDTTSTCLGLLAGLLSKSVIGDNGATWYSNNADKAGTGVNTGNFLSVAISGEKFVNNGINGHVKDADDQCENVLHYAGINLDFTTSAVVSFYSASQQGCTRIGPNPALTDATLMEFGATDPTDPYLKAKRGERLVVRVRTATLAATTKFDVVGSTAVFANDRIVDEKNY
jgi:hypothetical protein